MTIQLSNINTSIKNYIFIMKIAFNSAKKHFFILMAFSILNIAVAPITLYLGKKILDVLVSVEGKQSDVIMIIAIIVGFGLLTALIGAVQRVINALMSQLISNYITKIILEKSISLDLKYFDSSTYYEAQKNVQRTLGSNWEALILGSIMAVNSCITLIIMIGILSTLNILLVPIIIIGTLPGIIVGVYARNKQFHFYTHQIPEMRKIDYIKNVLTAPQFAKEIKLFQNGSYFMEKYHKAFSKMFKDRKKLQFSILFKEIGAIIIGSVSMGGCQLYIALKALNKVITIGDYSLYFGAVQNISTNLNSVLNILATSYEQMLLADVLVDYINLEPGIEIGKGVEIENDICLPLLKFDNVSFKYPDSDKYVLKGLNFTIEPGEKIAFVGLNGAGKTTIVKLMARLYNVTDGKILLNDKNIKIYKPEEIYRLFSAVFQDYAKYGLSIKENIAIGNLEKLGNQEEMEIVAKEVGLDKTINNLPNNYQTYVTKLYDMAGFSDISVGEWQKISIARAFFRPASFYILDEPTASLDPLVEHEIFKQFVKLCERKTAVLITHRLSNVSVVDRIFFLKDGEIIEEGSHDELIESGGEYASLFNLQASKYNSKTWKNKKNNEIVRNENHI